MNETKSEELNVEIDGQTANDEAIQIRTEVAGIWGYATVFKEEQTFQVIAGERFDVVYCMDQTVVNRAGPLELVISTAGSPTIVTFQTNDDLERFLEAVGGETLVKKAATLLPSYHWMDDLFDADIEVEEETFIAEDEGDTSIE